MYAQRTALAAFDACSANADRTACRRGFSGPGRRISASCIDPGARPRRYVYWFSFYCVSVSVCICVLHFWFFLVLSVL